MVGIRGGGCAGNVNRLADDQFPEHQGRLNEPRQVTTVGIIGLEPICDDYRTNHVTIKRANDTSLFKNSILMNPNFCRLFSVAAGLLLLWVGSTNALGQPGINGGKPIITYNTFGPVSIQTQSPPSFPGGEDELEVFVLKSAEEAKNSIRLPRKMWLTATIDKDGKVTSLTPTYDADPALKREMERIAERMPRWNPGLINSKGVETQFQFLVRR